MASPFTPQPQASAQVIANAPIKSRVAAAGAGATWWTEGWRIFRSHFGTWIGIVFAYFVVSLLLNAVPHIGAVAEWLLTPVFIGGIMLGCDALQRGQPLRLSHLFDGFKGPHFVPLLRVALCNLALLPAGRRRRRRRARRSRHVGPRNFANLATDRLADVDTLGSPTSFSSPSRRRFFTVIAMANWFAPALIVLRNAKPIAAMTASLRACMRNWLPFLVYGVIGIVIAIAVMAAFAALSGMLGFEAIMAIIDGNGDTGAFTFATGVLGAILAAIAAVVAAVIFGSTYASYRDTLAADDSAPDNPT